MEQLTIHVATGVVVIGPPGLFASQVVAACRRGQEMAALQYLRRDKDALARVRRWRDAEAHFPGVLRESDDRLVAMVEDAVRRHRLVAFYVPKAPASYNGGDIVERRAPVAVMDKSPDARIRAMTRIERLTEALTRCVKPAIMGPELTAYMTQLVREGAIPILAMYLLGIGIAHLAAPEVALLIDAALILFVAVQIGRTGTEALVALVTATVEAMDAKDEATIERSATAYAHALVALGGAVFLAWLLKRLPKYRAMKGGPSKGAAPQAAPAKTAPKPKKLIPAPKKVGPGGLTSDVWKGDPFQRGQQIEKALGHNLPGNFPVIDRFQNGLATSIKSLDLDAVTYQNSSTLSRTLTGYVDKVASFQGRTWAGVRIRPQDVTSRALDLAVPHGGSGAQQAVINQAVKYGASRGVTVNVIPIP